MTVIIVNTLINRGGGLNRFLVKTKKSKTNESIRSSIAEQIPRTRSINKYRSDLFKLPIDWQQFFGDTSSKRRPVMNHIKYENSVDAVQILQRTYGIVPIATRQ